LIKDEKKLVLHWLYDKRISEEKYWEHLELIYGIGGGSSEPFEAEAPFFPVNWINISPSTDNTSCELALISYCTYKHLLKNHELMTILAWGGDTARFGNRCDRVNRDFPKKMDLRLKGYRIYKFTIYPHEGCKRTEIPDIAMSLLRPPVALQCKNLNEKDFNNTSYFYLKDSMIPSSLFLEGDKLVCRAYESIGNDNPVSVNYIGMNIKPEICDVGDNPADIRPWGIYKLKVKAGIHW
jgi:hypothetical protein